MASNAASHLNDAAKAPILDGLLGTLAARVVGDASGVSIPAGTCLQEQPQKNLWLGMLASAPEIAGLPEFFGERRVPAAHGFTFRVDALPVDLDVTVSAALYLPVLPTAADQRKASSDPLQRPGADEDESDLASDTPAGASASIPITDRTIKVLTKPVLIGITVEEGLRAYGHAELAEALQQAVRHAHRTAELGLFRPPRRKNVPRPDTSDTARDADWRRYLDTSLVSIGDYVLPEYSAEVEIEARQHPDYAEVTVTLVNTTPATRQQHADAAQRVTWPANRLDTHLYEAQLTAETCATVKPVDLEQVRESYRYDRNVLIFGEATAAEIDPPGPSGRTRMRTRYGAEAPTSRVFPRDTSLSGKPLDMSFPRLISDPIDALSSLADAAQEWVNVSWSTRRLDQLQQERHWVREARAQADEDAEEARQEVNWVRAGVKELAADPDLREAFRQAMRAMQVIGARKGYTALHLFQAAWITGCLPAMKDPSSDPNVDILWFATGGGKSEAYLGLMLVTLFYARRTGTTAGSLVWARFPLRLLSLQQTERFGQVLAAAEQIRLADPATAAGDPFAVGYFVGSGNTPNKFVGRNSPYATADPTSEQVQQSCRVLDCCPTCGGLGAAGARDLQIAADAARTGSVAPAERLQQAQAQARGGRQRLEMRFDEPSWTMQHVCTSAGCPAAGPLQVYVIDDDIYRNLPSVLVGTVDKLAQLAMQKQFATLLGRAATRCPQHGYTADPQWCAVFGCQTRPSDRTPGRDGLGGLRLEIADEMHLLDEELGALDGLYETLLGGINQAMKNPPMCIVGATATLEGYEEQVRHLYQRPGRRFPANGPTVGENFWARTDESMPLRRYLGLRPRRIAYTTATIETAITHRKWLQVLAENPERLLAEAGLPADGTHLAVAREAADDLYEVFLAYALRNDDLGQFMREERLRDFHGLGSWAQVNGDADPGRIRDDVRRLTSPESCSPDERIRTIVATKAIGHGFDVPRLGVMVMMGTPTQASEVIQASARVGRKHPGLVINIANPTRDRDVSTHRYYKYWISYLDRLIHKVPINRESLPALQRVLSGGLMAWLLQFYDRGWVTGGPKRRSLADSDMLRDAIISGDLAAEVLKEALMAGFGIDPDDGYHEPHRKLVEKWIDETTRLIAAQGSTKRKTSDMLDPRVPRSLRDIEDPIAIFYES